MTVTYFDLVMGMTIGVTINSLVPELLKLVALRLLRYRQAHLKPVELPYVRMPVPYCVVPEWWDMRPRCRFCISLLGLIARFAVAWAWYKLSPVVSGTRCAAFLVGLLIAAYPGFFWYVAPGKPGPVANDGLGLTAAAASWILRRQGMQAAELERRFYDCLSPWHIAIFVALLYLSTFLAPVLAPQPTTMILTLIGTLLRK